MPARLLPAREACSRACSGGLFLEKLVAAHQAGRLKFFGDPRPPRRRAGVRGVSGPAAPSDWVVYAKRPFGGPQGRARLSVALHPPRRHRQSPPDRGRPHSASPSGGRTTGRWAVVASRLMTLSTDEFIRRFLIARPAPRLPPHPALRPARQWHAAPPTSPGRAGCSTCRCPPEPADTSYADGRRAQQLLAPCPCCGGRMIIIETFERGASPRTGHGIAPVAIRNRHLMIAVIAAPAPHRSASFSPALARRTPACSPSHNFGP